MKTTETFYKLPDVKGNRYRPSSHKVDNTAFFKAFYAKYPKYKSIKTVELKKIILAFNTNVWQEVIDSVEGIDLPEKLGYLQIISCTSGNKENINFPLSNKLGVRVHHTNTNTNGMISKILYNNAANHFYFIGSRVWKFQGNRTFKRTLAKVYPTQFNKYHLNTDTGVNTLNLPSSFDVEEVEAMDPSYNPLSLD